MEFLLLLLAIGGTAAGLRLVHDVIKDRERRAEDLRRTAEALGLTDVVPHASGLAGSVSIRARSGRLRVAIRQSGSGEQAGETRLSIRLREIRHRFRLQSEETVWPGGRRGEAEIGDESFDATFFITGAAAHALARLDAPTRELLLSLHRQANIEIDARKIEASLREGARGKLARVLEGLLRVARRVGEDVLEPQLARNAAKDPLPAVRLNNLTVLCRDYPEATATTGALRLALEDGSPRIRLRAALAVGAKGIRVLEQLAESLADDQCAAEAIGALGTRLSRKHIDAILDRALEERRAATAAACLDRLGRAADDGAVARLAFVLGKYSGRIAEAAATALGKTEAWAAEAALLAALQRKSPGLRLAAAQALGRVGTPAAVPALSDAEHGAEDPALARAAREAIVEIQSRRQGASPGQLSLTAADAGRLSLPSGEAGTVTIADDAERVRDDDDTA